MDNQQRVILGLGERFGEWIGTKVALGIEHGLQGRDLEDFDVGRKALDLENTTVTLCAGEELGHAKCFQKVGVGFV